tara:strand:+ start:935 stop:1162 length:228 start_codon:yes stop_codon:yes gene_type:complete
LHHAFLGRINILAIAYLHIDLWSITSSSFDFKQLARLRVDDTKVFAIWIIGQKVTEDISDWRGVLAAGAIGELGE